MALRHLISRGAMHISSAAGQSCRSIASAAATPSVYDKMVQINVVDGTGVRHPVRGMEGQTLMEVLENHEGPLDVSEYLCLSPGGRGEHECVVSVPNEFTRRIPPPNDDDFQALEQIAERQVTPNTRLGSKIILTKDLNDMLVALGAVFPWKTL